MKISQLERLNWWQLEPFWCPSSKSSPSPSAWRSHSPPPPPAPLAGVLYAEPDRARETAIAATKTDKCNSLFEPGHNTRTSFNLVMQPVITKVLGDPSPSARSYLADSWQEVDHGKAAKTVLIVQGDTFFTRWPLQIHSTQGHFHNHYCCHRNGNWKWDCWCWTCFSYADTNTTMEGEWRSGGWDGVSWIEIAAHMGPMSFHNFVTGFLGRIFGNFWRLLPTLPVQIDLVGSTDTVGSSCKNWVQMDRFAKVVQC